MKNPTAQQRRRALERFVWKPGDLKKSATATVTEPTPATGVQHDRSKH